MRSMVGMELLTHGLFALVRWNELFHGQSQCRQVGAGSVCCSPPEKRGLAWLGLLKSQSCRQTGAGRVMLLPVVQNGKPKNFPSNFQEKSIMWQVRPRSANALCFNFYPFHMFVSWNLETQLSFISIFIFHFWTLLPMNYPSFSSCWGVELFELCSAALVQFYHSFISVKLNNY